jgi:hypothetical protein
MVKLYKQDSNSLLYAECWVNEGISYIHLGSVGDTGITKQKACEDEVSFERLFINEYHEKGYNEVSDEKKYWLIIQWPIKEKIGKTRDLKIKDAAIGLLNEGLGWAGIGEVDGWDIGRSSSPDGESVLNIACIVVHETIGVRVVLDSLQKKVDCSNIRIATRTFTGEEYSLQYRANKDDTSFYE